MEWSGVSLLIADHSLCPRPCLVEEEFFLGLDPWPNIYIDMSSLAFHPHSGGIGKIFTYIATVHNSHLSQTQTLTLDSQTLNFLNS